MGPTRLLYALNAAAVEFQISAMRALSLEEGPGHSEAGKPRTGSFEYWATVASHGPDRFVAAAAETRDVRKHPNQVRQTCARSSYKEASQ